MTDYKRTIDNMDFFKAEEELIKTAMQKFELELLPVAKHAVEDAGFKTGEFKKEGYYDETPQLSIFFDLMRTLQNNFTPNVTPAIEKLNEIYTNKIFGIRQARATAVNSKNIYITEGEMLTPSAPVTVSPIVDPITIACDKTASDWTIEGIMDNVDREDLGECLVGLGILVDDAERQPHNPLATCMARESTAMTGYELIVLGYDDNRLDWQVTPKVEEYGKNVIDGYNSLFAKHSKADLKMPYVNKKNIEELLHDADLINRCVCITVDARNGVPRYYHWAINTSNSVVDFYLPKVMSTKEWQLQISPMLRSFYGRK